jgi:hypothetical protein
MTVKQIIRSILAIIVGIVVISILVEALEFALVTFIHGEPTTDPETYYGIRNQGWFLGIKLVYNTIFAAAGGYLAAIIAGYALQKHGLALAILQTIAFLFGLTQPDVSRWTPGWMWIALILLTFAGILYGARVRVVHSNP